MARPYENWEQDFKGDFLRKAWFTCKDCGGDCQLIEGRLQAEKNKMFAFGKCSRCGKNQKFDVTNVWREE